MRASKDRYPVEILTKIGFTDEKIELITSYPEHIFFRQSMLIVGVLFVIVFVGSVVAYIFALADIRHWLMESRTRGLDYLAYETIDIFHFTPLVFAIVLGIVLLFYVLRDLAYHVLLRVRVNPRRMESAAGSRLWSFIGRFVYFQLLARSRGGVAEPGLAVVRSSARSSLFAVIFPRFLARVQRGAAGPGRAIVLTSLYTSIALLVTAPVAVLDFSNYVLITERKIAKRGYGSINTDIFDFGDVVEVETMCKDYRDGRGREKTNIKYALHFRNGYEVDLFNRVDEEKIGKLLQIDRLVFAASPNARLVVKQSDRNCIAYLKDAYDERFEAVARLLRIRG